MGVGGGGGGTGYGGINGDGKMQLNQINGKNKTAQNLNEILYVEHAIVGKMPMLCGCRSQVSEELGLSIN